MMLAFRRLVAGEHERSDRRFVIATWSSSFKSSWYAGMIATEDWATVMHSQIARLLDRPTTTTIVAHDLDDPGFLYGFVAGDVSDRSNPVVHYTYTKETYRRASGRLWDGPGVARSLFAELGVAPHEPFLFTCKTPVLQALHEKTPRASWQPMLARYPRET